MITDALEADLGRDRCETYVAESAVIETEIAHFLKNLKSWMRPQQLPTPGVMFPGFTQMERRPLNSPGICVIGSCNYPLNLSLRPVVGALAAGNPVVVKPSELNEQTCHVLAKLIPKYFEEGALQVVTGGVDETTALLEKPWGMMVFTGSERVGKIVGEKCAATLTPVLLELGGKSPAIVDETATNIKNVADRLIFGKLLNAGQTCVTADTLFVHEKHFDPLCNALLESLENQYGKDPKKGPFSRLAQSSHAYRQLELIQEAEEDADTTILCGGSKNCDPLARYVPPTLISVGPKSRSLRIMKEEVFGPILPIVKFSSREEAIEMVQDMPGTPLAMMVFTSQSAVFEEFKDRCRSGMAFRNDLLLHMASPYINHGGLGTSGIGGYHGKRSYETFTHPMTVCHRPLGSVYDAGNLRYHPYTGTKATILEFAIKNIPDTPVLHTRKILTAVGIAIALKLLVNVSGLAVKPLLADILEVAVKFLRK